MMGIDPADLGYSAAWRGVKALPAPIARASFAAVADLATRRNGGSVAQLRRNLARVLPADADDAALESTVQAGMRSYARYWLETFRLPVMAHADVISRMQTNGIENLERSIKAGKGSILALSHSGNWDISGLWLIDWGQPFTTVAERLKPESLFDRFVAYREGIGMRVLPLTGGERNPFDILTERLQANEVVCLLADRDLSRRGIEVNFFGEPTRMPAGPARLAITTGASLIPVNLSFTEHGWRQDLAKRIPVPVSDGSAAAQLAQVQQMTQKLADSFAASIAAHPQDWHMLAKLWLADLPPRPDVAADSHDTAQGGVAADRAVPPGRS